MKEMLPIILQGMAGISLVAVIISAIIASQSTREARSTIFPIVQELETARARRARFACIIFGSLAAISLSGWFAAASLGLGPTNKTPLIASIASTQENVTPTATNSPIATTPPTVTATAILLSVGGNATEQPLPTSTSRATIQPANTTVPAASPTLTSSEPAPANAKIDEIIFATDVTPRREPINPGNSFSAGIGYIYAVFKYSGFRNGTQFTVIWYRNGVEFARDSFPWRWGTVDRSYVSCFIPGEGSYRLELFVNRDMLATGVFTATGY